MNAVRATHDFLIQGILNFTPDSFSDGGKNFDVAIAAQKVSEILAHGADIIDVGAESTRPGAKPVSPEDEWKRLEPLLSNLSKTPALLPYLSLDTRYESTALQAFDLGIRFFNNVSGLFSSLVLKQIARDPTTRYIAMHMHGQPQTMQKSPLQSKEARRTVQSSLRRYHEELIDAGFARNNIFLDPGFGFGKSDAANIVMLQLAHEMSREFKIALGVSRKGFIGRLTGIENPTDRDGATKMLELGAALSGVRLIRTHDVAGLAKIRALMRSEE